MQLEKAVVVLLSLCSCLSWMSNSAPRMLDIVQWTRTQRPFRHVSFGLKRICFRSESFNAKESQRTLLFI